MLLYHLDNEDEYCIEVKIPNAELINLGGFILYDDVENKPMIFNDPLIANKAAMKLNKWLDENRQISVNAISAFSKMLNVAPVIVGRLQYLKRVKYSAYNKLKIRYDWH